MGTKYSVDELFEEFKDEKIENDINYGGHVNPDINFVYGSVKMLDKHTELHIIATLPKKRFKRKRLSSILKPYFAYYRVQKVGERTAIPEFFENKDAKKVYKFLEEHFEK